MCDQETIEYLKLGVEFATLVTTIVIAVAGFSISKRLQGQNEIAERKSSWLEKWAGDFYKAASGFNDSATSLLFLYLKSEWDEIGDGEKHGAGVNIQELSPDPSRSLPFLLELNRGWYEMNRFVGLADEIGEDIMTAASDLLTEAVTWHKNGGGDKTTFQQKQLTFNKNFKKVHAELLELKDSK